jgi:hypothetical protein
MYDDDDIAIEAESRLSTGRWGWKRFLTARSLYGGHWPGFGTTSDGSPDVARQHGAGLPNQGGRIVFSNLNVCDGGPRARWRGWGGWGGWQNGIAVGVISGDE